MSGTEKVLSESRPFHMRWQETAGPHNTEGQQRENDVVHFGERVR